MNEFTRFLAETAHVADRQILYYVGWVQQAYELAGADVGASLSGKAEKRALTRLQQGYEDWPGQAGPVLAPAASLRRRKKAFPQAPGQHARYS